MMIRACCPYNQGGLEGLLSTQYPGTPFDCSFVLFSFSRPGGKRMTPSFYAAPSPLASTAHVILLPRRATATAAIIISRRRAGRYLNVVLLKILLDFSVRGSVMNP